MNTFHEFFGRARTRFGVGCAFLWALATPLVDVQGQSFNIDTASRETVRVFYNTVYQASEGVAHGWTGNVANCVPGTVSAAYQDATALRVNYFRAMAGLPSTVTFSEANNARAQAAALLMSANRQLNHEPPNTWKCYTEEGRAGAFTCNLNMGRAGAGSIDSFMSDGGSNNTEVGHRRWILKPEQQVMGSGHIPAPGTDGSTTAALYVFGASGPRPTPRDEFVAWPPKGFVPYQVVYPRWHFGYKNANFDNATVTMQRNGTAVPLKIEAKKTSTIDINPESAIVWIPNNLNDNADWPRPTQDEVYTVTVNNVVIGGAPRNFTYTVTVFDPAVPGPDYTPAVVSGPDNPALNQAGSYTFTAVPAATGYQWRATKLVPLNLTDGAETGAANWNVVVGNYNPVDTNVKAAGNAGYRLTRSAGGTEQTLTFKRTLLANAASQITFKSRIESLVSLAAVVEVSTDNGSNWTVAYSQNGSENGEGTFSDKVVNLGAYAGQQIRIRFGINFVGGPWRTCCDPIGWYFDEVTFINLHEVTNLDPVTVASGTGFSFTGTESAEYNLNVRPQFYSRYWGEWGPAKRVSTLSTVAAAPTITTQPQGQTVVQGANVAFTVAAQGSLPLSFVWKRNGTDLTDGAGITGSRTATLSLQNVQAASAGSYTVQVSNGSGNTTSSPAVLVVNEPPSLASAVNTTGLNWTTSGNVNWFTQNTVSRDGSAVQSGRISDNQESRLQVTVTGPATVSFWWKVESELNYDFLRVDLDGTQQFRISGNINWEQKTVTIPAGNHTLLWVYSKDASVGNGADSGYLDQVEVRQSASQPQTPPAPSLGEALDAPTITWAASGDRPWFAQTTITHDNSDAIQSGPITHSQSSRIEATILGPANLTFWWKVDSEQNYDFLTFELDNAAPAAAQPISGNVNWEQKTVPIPAGTHTIRWTYSKDGSESGGTDTAYVDQVVLTRLTPGEGDEPGPLLEFTASGSKLRITWPEVAENYKLQVSPSLTQPKWTDVSENDISKEQGEFYIIVNTSTSTQFYRLIEQ